MISGRPVIGICAELEHVRYEPWEEDAAMLPKAYVDSVQRGGGVVLMIPPDDGLAEDPTEVLDLVDALILAGGSDVDPLAYGAERHPETGRSWPERDRFELAMTHEALERDLPLLAVCRGVELLNVATGGTLEQHLPDRLGSDRHNTGRGEFDVHEVRLAPGSLAAHACGGELTRACSSHHQGLGELGEGLVATGWSVDDEVVEAVERPDRRFALGVLWHPEEDPESRVIPSLVDAVRLEAAR